MADRIGAVIIDVQSDVSHLVQGMKKAEGIVEGSTKVMLNAVKALAVGYSVVSLKNLIDETAQLTVEQTSFAEQLSISTTALSSFEYVASKAHVSTDAMRDAFKDAGTKVTEFQRDGESAKEAFKALGISQDFAKEKMYTTERSMNILLQRLAEFPDGMQKATIAQEIFGDEGANVIRVANLGSEAIAKYTDEAIRGNIATSEAFAQKTASYADAQSRLEALEGGWSSAVIEESHFLEMGTNMYELLSESVLSWTEDVQSGNNTFVNGLESIAGGVDAVFPTVIEISGIVASSFVTVGSAVVDVAGVVVELGEHLLGLDTQTNSNITTLGHFAGLAIGTAMAVENFAGLVKLSANGLEYFGAAISTYAISRLDYLQSKFYSSMATISDFMSFIDDDYSSSAKEYARKANSLENDMFTALGEGNAKFEKLGKERMQILHSIHSAEEIQAKMEATAIEVSKRQNEAFSKIDKKIDLPDYEKQGKKSVKQLENVMKALENAKNKKSSLSKSTLAHTKALKSEARAYKDVEKAQKDEYLAWEKENAKMLKALEEKQKAEIEYQDLLGNYDYGDQLEYEKKALWFKERGVDVTSKEIQALEQKRDLYKEIESIIKGFAENSFDNILKNIKEGMSLSQATTAGLNDSARGFYSDMKNSNDPMLKGIGYGVDIIEALGSTFEPLIVNEHIDNKEIINSMAILNNTMYPHLKLTEKMSASLESMDKKFDSMARGVLYGDSDMAGEGFAGYDGGMADTLAGQYVSGIVEFFTGGLLGGIGDGIANFISVKKVSLENSGLHLHEQSALSYGDGVSATQYQNVRTRSSAFGVTYSDSSSIKDSNLASSMQQDLDSIFKDATHNIIDMADSLGILGGESRLAEAKLKEIFLDFKDMDEKQIKEALQGEIGNRISAIAEIDLGGALDKFRHTGEGYYELLTRVAVGFEQGNHSIERLGFQMVEFKGIVSNTDLENLNADTTEFVRGFYSASEQVALSGRDVNESFKALGITLPKGKKEFRKLVESLDLTTEEGRATYASLMQTSGAFASFRDGIESIINSLRDAQSAYAVPQTYTSASVYDEIDNYAEYGNDAVGESIDAWYAQEVARLEETKSYQVTIDNSHNKALNAQIELSNAWHDSIKSMQETSKKGLTSLIIDNAVNRSRHFLTSSIANKDENGINSAYSSILNDAKNNSLSRADELKKVALANFEIQQIKAPEKRDLLDVSIRTETHTRDISSAMTQLNLNAYNMYEELIKKNTKDLEVPLDIASKDIKRQTEVIIEDSSQTRTVLEQANSIASTAGNLNISGMKDLQGGIKDDFASLIGTSDKTSKNILENFNRNSEIFTGTNTILGNNNQLFGLVNNKNIRQDSDISKLTKEMNKLVKQNEELVELNKEQLQQNKNQSKELNEMKNSENRREAREKAGV